MDEILIKTRSDGSIVLDGHADRGPIYAVHQYLEDFLGVRWWTATESIYPHWAGEHLPFADVRFNPPFKYRETFFQSTFDATFKVRGKGNFASCTRYIFPPIRQEIPTAEMGGAHRLYFYRQRHSAYHSFFEVIPHRLIKTHPDWFSYSEKEGKRVPKQLCVTNEEMTRAYIEETLKLLREKPDTTFIQVSQNDDAGYCECATCKKVYEEEGAVSGAYLRFVNRVAETIAKEFPNVTVDTFAYMFTRKAPKKTRPAKNVVVRLCDIECGFNFPLADSPESYKENRAFLKDLEDWSKVAKGRLYIWDYIANFRHYMLPRANIRALVSNLRLFAASGAIGIFEQGDALCAAGTFAPLKQYLCSHLMWNPSADDRQLILDFLTGYYGRKAGPKIKAFLELLEREAADPKSIYPLTCCQAHYRAWLSPRGHLEAMKLMNEAVAAAELDGPEYAVRVRRERLSIEHALIQQFRSLKDLAKLWKIDWPMRDATRLAAVERWISEVKSHGVLAYEETTDPGSLERYFAKLREEAAKEPAVSLASGKTEIVISIDAPKSVRFAADELRDFLSQTFGRPVPVVTKPTEGRTHLFLGENEWSRKAGLSVAELPRDAYWEMAEDANVYLLGRDDPKVDTRDAIFNRETGVWAQYHEHATLFAVYGFLDKYAGVRMYFPGELGTIVPKRVEVSVPAGVRMVAPDFIQRNCCAFTDGLWYEGDDRANPLLPARKLNYNRQRLQTFLVPCCHGEHCFNILKRFGKTHPEYFVQKADGTRRTGAHEPFPGHLCHTSAVWDEIYRDVVSYAKGEPADVRGMGPQEWTGSDKQEWHINAFRRPWVDLMPQDGFQPCQCANCKAAYGDEKHYATDLIWGRTVELADRLNRDGIPLRVTQMSYSPYARVPDFNIPTNVDVMVAVAGPWSAANPSAMDEELGRMRDWRLKLGRKVWLWTYPGKYMQTLIPDVPDLAPRAWSRYLKASAPYVFGAYMETQDERMFYHYLDYYVFGKLCWDNGVDTETLLAEHFELMFGPAALEMSRFVDELERKWVGEVTAKVIDTDYGPTRQPPSPYELFTRIYGPDVIGGWRALFASARGRVRAGSLEARRIDLYEREFLLPLAKRAAAYIASTATEPELLKRSRKGSGGNLLANGDFSLPQPSSASLRHFGLYENGVWKGGWIGSRENVANMKVVREAPRGLPASMRFSVMGNARTVSLTDTFSDRVGHLKPGCRYRISLFVKLDNVVGEGESSGVGVRAMAGVNPWFPERRLTGSTDWIHQEFFFTAAANADKVPNALGLYLYNATGTVLFSGVRLEEEN